MDKNFIWAWLENRKSDDFQRLMREALLEAYDTFCIDEFG